MHGAVSPDWQASAPIPAASVRCADEELHEQLTMLEPEGHSLKLPIQQLSRFADIWGGLEKVGGIYRVNPQRFDFEDRDVPAAIVDRLINGHDARSGAQW